MSRVYEALRNAQEQRTIRGPLEADAIQQESRIGEPGHNGKAARGIPEILSALRPEGAPPAQPLQLDELQQACAKPVVIPEGAPPGRPLQLDELQKRCARPGWKSQLRWNVFPKDRPCGPQAEQFRTLRARLYSLRETRAIQTLLVTSTTAAEGKTFVAMNLAQSIARQRGRRALLVDADLRASRLHIALGAPPAPGLSDYLAGESDECSIIQAEAQEGLFFIPGGNPRSNPAELLANNHLRDLFSRVLPLFDWIVVDAPPVLPVSDARVLAGMCDGVIFVARVGVAAFDKAQSACGELKRENLLGVVLNGVEEEAIYGAYGYY
jgi:capsular exopolysaccharide synthesis family protein